MSGLRSGFAVALGRVGLVLALTAALVVGSPSPVGAVAGYGDLSEGSYYHEAVTSLKEQGVFEGTDCEEGFCPEDPMERWQMAVWLIRVLDGQEPMPVSESRFVDVDAQESWAPFVERLSDLEITTGCNQEPPKYCPQSSVRRNQMATFLYRAFDLPDAKEAAGFVDVSEDSWAYKPVNALMASKITTGCNKLPLRYCPDNLVTKAQAATFLHRVLKWQRGEQPTKEKVVNHNPNNIPGYDPDIFYTEENEISRFIKEEVVDRYAEDNPWLLETWNHTNRPDFRYAEGKGHATVSFSYIDAEYEVGEILDKYVAADLFLPTDYLNDRFINIIIHELAHVYTLSDGANAHPGPTAIAHLYFDQLSDGNGLCLGSELYAEAAEMLVPTRYNYFTYYWHACSHLPSRVTPEAIEIAEDAFAGRMPQWFYDTFQKTDGNLDYEMLWTAVNNMLWENNRIEVIYQLRNEFGGYCSEQAARDSAFGDLQLDQPWRDGGCPTDS